MLCMADLNSFLDENLDIPCLELIDNNPNLMVPWYLMAAYAYYVEDNPILSDNVFDKLAKRMLECWDKIDHFHKESITVDDLKAGTFLGEYPSRVEGGVKQLREVYYGKKSAGVNRRGN
jgi:hypothetical protein